MEDRRKRNWERTTKQRAKRGIPLGAGAAEKNATLHQKRIFLCSGQGSNPPFPLVPKSHVGEKGGAGREPARPSWWFGSALLVRQLLEGAGFGVSLATGSGGGGLEAAGFLSAADSVWTPPLSKGEERRLWKAGRGGFAREAGAGKQRHRSRPKEEGVAQAGVASLSCFTLGSPPPSRFVWFAFDRAGTAFRLLPPPSVELCRGKRTPCHGCGVPVAFAPLPLHCCRGVPE